MVKLVAGIGVLAVVGISVVAVAVSRLGGDDVEASVQREMPAKADYSFVALPTTAPPVGASVETAHYADEEKDGQVVLLRYPELTLQACSLIVDVSDPKACAARDRDVLRVVTHDGVRTTVFLGTKEGAPSAASMDSSSDAAGLVGELRSWVADAQFTAGPDWVAAYAHDHLEGIYQG
jgi:hypothetical protein